MEQTTFNDLCKAHYTAVHRYMCHKYKEMGDDITQEAFLLAQESCGSFREDSKFKTWVIAIGVNYASRMHIKASKLDIDVDADVKLVADYTTPEDIYSAKQLSNIADEVIEGMSPKRKAMMESAERSLDKRHKHTLDYYTRRNITNALGVEP